MANKIVKGVMTIDGVAQIDYTSLANLPTIDTIPTFRSANAVQSGAVYDALAGKMDATNGVVQNPVFEWKGADGSTVSFKQVTSGSKTTFGFVHTAANGTMTYYPFMETTTEGHKTLFSEAEHKHNASDISSGTLSSDRLPVLPAAKLETVPVNKGGTGATTVAGALTNLDAARASTHEIAQFMNLSTLGLGSETFSATDFNANIKKICDAMDSVGGVEQNKFVMPFTNTHNISKSVFAKISSDLSTTINCYIDLVLEKYNTTTIQVYVYLQGSSYRGVCFYCMCDISDSAKTTKFVYAHHQNGFMSNAGGAFTGAVTYTTLSGGNITSNGAITTTGNITGAKVYGAVWNDYAEFRNATEEIEPGRIVCENGDDTVSLSIERLQAGALATSDTYGFAIGETEECKCPIAVAGRVLVFPYEDRDSYAPGDPVCAAPGGTVSKMTREEVVMYPDRIVGTVSAIPTYETWSSDKIKVQNRIWIKI